MEGWASDDELTVWKLRNILERWPDLHTGITSNNEASIKVQLGWIRTLPKYCQLICEANKDRHSMWYNKRLPKNNTIQDIIWNDECSNQLDHHGRLCFRKMHNQQRLKPKLRICQRFIFGQEFHEVGQHLLLLLLKVL